MIFVDTDYFLRLLIGDVKEQHQKAKTLFLKGAEGKLKLFTSIIVIFEIYWVLNSFYQKKKEKVIEILEKIFQLKFVKIENSNILQEAIKIYKITNLDLEDSYNLVLVKAKGIKIFKTFDRKLEKVFSKNTF